MPEPRSDVKWEYTDEIAQMQKRIAALDAEVAALKVALERVVLNASTVPPKAEA